MPGLYRLSEPERDGLRRTRQAVNDLRRQGYTVQADIRLDPALTDGPPFPFRPSDTPDRRTTLAQAAALRTTQRPAHLTAAHPPARPMSSVPARAPAVRPAAPGSGRSR